MIKPKYWTYFSFAGDEPWLFNSEDKSFKSAIRTAERFLKRGRRPDGNFVDQAFIYKAEYDPDYEDWEPVGEPVWVAGEPFGPIDIDEASNYLSYWIDPYGEIYAVPIHGHGKIGAMLVGAGIIPDIEEGMFGSPPIRVGWLQVTTEPGKSTTFNFEDEPTQRQLDALFDIVLEHKKLEYSNNSRLFVEDTMKWLAHPEITRKNPEDYSKKEMLEDASVAADFLLENGINYKNLNNYYDGAGIFDIIAVNKELYYQRGVSKEIIIDNLPIAARLLISDFYDYYDLHGSHLKSHLEWKYRIYGAGYIVVFRDDDGWHTRIHGHTDPSKPIMSMVNEYLTPRSDEEAVDLIMGAEQVWIATGLLLKPEKFDNWIKNMNKGETCGLFCTPVCNHCVQAMDSEP